MASPGSSSPAAFTIFNFLTYGTTAVVARASGAGEEDRAARLAAQALWVSLAIGAVLLVVLEAVGEPLLRALGGHGESGHDALVYFRIAAFGLPAALIALAGQGYLRGVANLRRPLVIVVLANVVNLVLEVLFVYGFHWGIAGSAAGTAIAQTAMGIAFVVELLRPHATSRTAEPDGDAADGARRLADLRADDGALRVVSRRGVGARAHGRSRSSARTRSRTSCSSSSRCSSTRWRSPAR